MSFPGRRLPLFAAIVAVVLALVPACASADPYHLVLAGGSNASVYGIDRYGDLVFSILNGGCSGPGTLCYDEISSTGVPLAVTALPPSLPYDNGTPCSGALPTGFSLVGAATCNNGHEVFGGEYYNPALVPTLCVGPTSGALHTFCVNNGDLIGLFTGFNPFTDYFAISGDRIVLNAAGDFGVNDGLHEQVDLGIDLVPEPNTLALVAAGCLSLFWIARRRLIINL